jgi:hypothetical protein
MSHIHLPITMSLDLIVRVVLFITSIVCAPVFGTLRSRRLIIFTFNVILAMCYPECSPVITLSTFHSLFHEHIPFIDEYGLNVNHSAFFDVLIHTLMYVQLMWLVRGIVSMETLFVLFWVLAGSVYNTVVSIYSRVDDDLFVQSSLFQALSSGAWVSLLGLGLDSNSSNTVQYECLLWVSMGVAVLNWYAFRQSTWLLAVLFRASYFDTFFNVPVWLYVWNRCA